MAFSLSTLKHVIQPQVGIELGTQTTRVSVPGKGVVLTTATALVAHEVEKKVVLYGDDAREMLGKIAAPLQLYLPVRDGQLVDDHRAVQFVRHCFHTALGAAFLLKPEVVASIPSGATPAQRQMFKEVLFRSGARQVNLIDTVLAAAIGAGVPVADSGGNVIVHLDSGHTEVAIISLGTIVARAQYPIGTEHLDQALQRHLRVAHQLAVSLPQAQEARVRLSRNSKDQYSLTGRLLTTNAPTTISIAHQELDGVMARALAGVDAMLVRFLEDVPPAQAADILDKGILLTGPLSTWRGVESHMSNLMRVPVTVAEEPSLCVIHGVETALDHLSLYKQSLASS